MAANQSVCQNLRHCYEIHPCNRKHLAPTNQKEGRPTYTLENSPEIVIASIPNHHCVVVSLMYLLVAFIKLQSSFTHCYMVLRYLHLMV